MRHHINQEGIFRKGVVLGLTVAEVMILLAFILMLMMGAALARKEREIRELKNPELSRLVEVIKERLGSEKSEDEFFKELVKAMEIIDQSRSQTPSELRAALLDDAKLGKQLRESLNIKDSTRVTEVAEKIKNMEGRDENGNYPPFFNLSEAGGYFFESGKAELKPVFADNLQKEVIPKLVETIAKYNVDVVEVTGHTDEVPIAGVRSNLDRNLIAASEDKLPIGSLVSGDNAGLALARATAVVQRLRADGRLKDVRILPLSGAQMILPGDILTTGANAGDDESRRRIEIRLRKSSKEIQTTLRE